MASKRTRPKKVTLKDAQKKSIKPEEKIPGHFFERTNKDGSIRYGWRISQEDENGNKVKNASGNYEYEYKFADTHDEVCKLAIEFLAERSQAREARKPENITVDCFFEKEWFYTIIAPTIKPTTLDTYESVYKNHIAPVIGEKKIRDLMISDGNQIINEMKAKNISRGRIKIMLSFLQELTKSARDMGFSDTDRIAQVKLPSKDKFEKKRDNRPFTEEEVMQLFDEMGHQQYVYQDAIIIALSTGLRAGEICALNKADIEERDEMRIIHVSRNAVYVKERDENYHEIGGVHEVITSTKTESGVRDISLSKASSTLGYEAIGRLLERNPECEALVCDSKGKRANYKQLQECFQRIKSNAGIKCDGALHACRRTFSTMLNDSSVDFETQRVLMGHENINTTMKYYVKPNAGRKQEATDGIGIALTELASNTEHVPS